MLAIDRTIVGHVNLLLLDEPFEELATLIIMEIRKVIQNVTSGLTVTIVEEHAELALGLSSRTHILENGRASFSVDSQVIFENKELGARYLAAQSTFGHLGKDIADRPGRGGSFQVTI